MNLTPQSVSDIIAPIFRDIVQKDNSGTFEVELEVPGQEASIPPVSVRDGKRLYTVRLYLDGVLAVEREYPEGTIQKVEFTYANNDRVIVLGSVVDGDGVESDVQECRYVVRFVAGGCVADFDGCVGAVLDNCVFEGASVGLLVRSSSLSVIDCEIILDRGGTFISKDAGSSVMEQNVKKVTRP